MGDRALVGMPNPMLYSLSVIWFTSLAGLFLFGGRIDSLGNLLFIPLGASSIIMLLVVPVEAYALISNKDLRTFKNIVAFSSCGLPLLLYVAAIFYGSLAWGI